MLGHHDLEQLRVRLQSRQGMKQRIPILTVECNFFPAAYEMTLIGAQVVKT